MYILSLLNVFAFCSYLYIGFLIFYINPRSKTHLFFLLSCLGFAIWSFGYIFIHNNVIDYEKNIIWYKIAFTGSSLFEVFILYFALAISGKYEKIKRKVIFFILIIIVPCIIIFKNLTECSIIKDYPFGLWFVLWMTYGYLYNFISFFIFYNWRKKTNKIREKKQASVIMISALITIILGSISDTVIVGLNIPSISSIIVLIWLFSIGFTVMKYRFLSITPELVSKNIIKIMNESIILVDENLKIVTMNKKTEELIGISQDKMRHRSLSYIIKEYELLKNRLGDLFQEKFSNFSCRINYQKKDDHRIFMDTKFSILRDRFNDIIGILIIGHEVKEIKQLKTIYQITYRESDVIQHIILGLTNKEIAKKLNIAERTIKTHITHIYDKLGVDNKMQLLHLLKDFNLIPEQNADKVLFFFKK